MKNVFLILTFFFSKAVMCQTKSIIGAWFSRDSAITLSYFFDAEGRASYYSGKNDSVIEQKKIIKGRYRLKNNILRLNWLNGKSEEIKITFINEFTMEFLFNYHRAIPKKFIFKKAFDEEEIIE